MSGPGVARAVLGMAFAHARRHWGRSALIAASVAVVAAIPLLSRAVVSRFEAALRARAGTVPMVVGAKGSRFDLVFAALHFRRGDIGTMPLSRWHELSREPGVVALPVHVRFTARGEPIAATTIEYLEFRGLRPRAGRVFAALGEAVLGARAAGRLGMGVGDELPSDQARSYDITAPPSLVMRVVGVLAPSGGPDDDAVFVDLETAWVLEGIAHGHEDAASVTDPGKLIGRAGDHVALSGAVIEHQRVTPETAGAFHLHGPRDALPLSAVLVVPDSERTETILRTRVNASPGDQAVSPARVVDDLIAFVLRIRTLLDLTAAVLGTATLALIGLIAALTVRARAEELATLREIGCGRATLTLLVASEFAALAGVGLAAAGGLALAGPALADSLLPLLS